MLYACFASIEKILKRNGPQPFLEVSTLSCCLIFCDISVISNKCILVIFPLTSELPKHIGFNIFFRYVWSIGLWRNTLNFHMKYIGTNKNTYIRRLLWLVVMCQFILIRTIASINYLSPYTSHNGEVNCACPVLKHIIVITVTIKTCF